MAEYGGGHRFLMNAYRGEPFTFQTIDRGRGVMSFSAIRIRKSADLIPDAYKCVFGKGEGACYFSRPDGGRVMQFYHLGIGGGSTFFFLLRGAVCHPPPPPLKFMNSLLMIIYCSTVTTVNTSLFVRVVSRLKEPTPPW